MKPAKIGDLVAGLHETFSNVRSKLLAFAALLEQASR